MPIEFKKKDINEMWIGWIFTAYPMAIVTFSPFVATIIGKHGRKIPIRLGMLLMGSSFIAYGLLSHLESKTMYIVIAFLTRILQGISSTLIQTTLYSISTNIYPDHSMEFIGYIQAMEGLGLVFGAGFGTVLYVIGGYNFIFLSFGILFVVFSLAAKYIFDSSLDHVASKDANNSETSQITTLELLKHPRYLMAALSATCFIFYFEAS